MILDSPVLTRARLLAYLHIDLFSQTGGMGRASVKPALLRDTSSRKPRPRRASPGKRAPSRQRTHVGSQPPHARTPAAGWQAAEELKNPGGAPRLASACACVRTAPSRALPVPHPSDLRSSSGWAFARNLIGTSGLAYLILLCLNESLVIIFDYTLTA